MAYDGDRGRAGESFTVRADRSAAVSLHDAANPVGDAMNSTIAEKGKAVPGRKPAYANTLGYDSDVFDLSPALKRGAKKLSVRFGADSVDGYHLGALFLEAEARR